eukprot:s1893_g10.t1
MAMKACDLLDLRPLPSVYLLKDQCRRPEVSKVYDLLDKGFFEKAEDNPFKLPSDDKIFAMREEERQRRAEERERVKHQHVWEKVTAACRHSRTRRIDDIDDAQASAARPDARPEGLGRDARRDKDLLSWIFPEAREAENISDFVAKKREMFLVQMSLDVKKAEILKLDARAKDKEEALNKSKQMLDKDVERFDAFLSTNDDRAHDAMQKADTKAREKQERVIKIKQLKSQLSAIQSPSKFHRSEGLGFLCFTAAIPAPFSVGQAQCFRVSWIPTMASAYTVVGKDAPKDVEVESGLESSTSGDEDEGLWRLAALGIVLKLVLKDPVNHPYHHMRLTVFFGFGFPFLLQWLGKTSLTLQPLLLMVILFLAIQSVLLAVTGLWLQMGLALALLVAVLGLAWPYGFSFGWLKDFYQGAYQHLFDPATKFRLKIYTFIFSGFPFFLLMPIFGTWEQVQRWVRWHPYNLDAELLWRGTFATFALALFFTAANPKVNNSIVAFFAAHGVCHSVSMFIDNRLLPTDGNDNVEHLLEISIFMAIGLFHFFVGREVWY